MDLSTLGESGIKANLERYIQCFSKDAREIFDHFKFAEFIGLLSSNNWRCRVGSSQRLSLSGLLQATNPFKYSSARIICTSPSEWLCGK